MGIFLVEKNNTKPHVSIIVHNYNGLKKLQTCLISLLKSNYPNMKIIVVDALTTGIENWIKSFSKDIDLLHFDRDDGIPIRRNSGLKLIDASSKYVVFMDEDVTVSKNWLFPLIDAMESDSAIGAAQPVMLSKRRNCIIDNAGCYIDFFGYPHRDEILNHEILNNCTKDISYAETAAILVRSEFLNALPNPHEPFDPDYLVHWYDIDFCWKILLSGFRVVIVPNSIVYHERRLSAGSWRLPYRNIFLNTRNRFVTLIKNYSFWNLMRFVPPFILLEITRSVILLKRKPRHAIATFHGILWVLRNLKSISVKRSVVQKLVRKVHDSFVLARFLRPNFLRLYRDFQVNYSVSTQYPVSVQSSLSYEMETETL